MSSDPLGQVLDIGRRISIPVAIALAVFLHAGFAASAASATMFVDILKWNRSIRAAIVDRLTQEYEVDVEKPPPPPPPPEPEIEKPPPPPPSKEVPKDEPPPDPAPQIAQAQAVLTADPKPDEPVDLTGDTIVNGTGDTSSGASSANGHGQIGSLSKVARTDGQPGGTGTAAAAPPPPTGPDLSRKAGPGSADWNDCGFPPEADAEQIDEAYVLLQVNVTADGRPGQINIVQDPGHGFGRQAKICAQRKSYQTAFDHDGHPIPGTTNKFSVHFIH